MNWTPDSLRQLRYRLGWSQAELARSLGCQLQVIHQWESGQVPPTQTVSKRLTMILNQADSSSEAIQRRPVAEVIMNHRGLAQIHDSEVIDCLASGAFGQLTFKP